MDSKSKKVVIRLKMPPYDFLKSFAEDTNRTLSDVIRNAIEDYYYRMFLGKLSPTTQKLQKEFLEKFGNEKRRIKELKKRPIKLKPIS